MNDQQFLERAHANPHDDSPEFLAAAADNPQRQRLLDGLKKLDGRLRAGLESVSPPASLRQALLDIPLDRQVDMQVDMQVDIQVDIQESGLHPDTGIAAANDSFWRRYAHYAAVLVIALGVIGVYMQGGADPMEEMVFSHIYSEIEFLDDDTPVTLDNVNFIMATLVGTEFANSPDMQGLQINVTKDCFVDFTNGIQAVHIVMQGDMGPVTVMVIPNTPLDAQLAIADDRFDGLISPTSGGNLVVVGEKNEPILQYSTMLAANLNW